MTPAWRHSITTDMSLGSWSSISVIPAPIVCSVPAGTNSTSPARTGTLWSALSITSESCSLTQPRRVCEVDRLAQSEVHVRSRLRLEDQPRLGLAEVGVQVLAGELATRVEVDRQALAGIEQLYEHAGVRAERGDVLGTEEADWILRR